jgi:AcrR family transcriptional regulator
MVEASVKRPKRLSAADRRAHILVAARRVFTRSGFAGARIKTISEEARVNEALLYRHFASKEELFEAAIVEPLQESVDRLLAIGRSADEHMGSEEARRGYVAQLMEEMLEGVMEIAPLIGVVLFSDEERGATFYREHFAPALRRLTEGLTTYQTAHTDPAVPDYDPRLVVELSVGAALLLSLDRRFGDRTESSSAEIAQQLADHLLRITDPPAPGPR